MKCQVCGNLKARFVVSRKKFWKGRSRTKYGEKGIEPRTDFRVKCPECGAEYIDEWSKTVVLEGEE